MKIFPLFLCSNAHFLQMMPSLTHCVKNSYEDKKMLLSVHHVTLWRLKSGFVPIFSVANWFSAHGENWRGKVKVKQQKSNFDITERKCLKRKIAITGVNSIK